MSFSARSSGSAAASRRVNRGTALPDGSPIEATSKALSRRRKTKQLAGSFEGCALELVEVVRSLDLAIARFKVAKPALAQAVEAWSEAVAQLPKTVERSVAESRNGDAPSVVAEVVPGVESV